MQRIVVCLLLSLISALPACRKTQTSDEDRFLHESKQEESVLSSQAKATHQNSSPANDRYFLIVDIYTQEESARERCAQLREIGFGSVSVMQNKNGYFCVSVHSYKTSQGAKKALAIYRTKKEFQKVWIMEKASVPKQKE